MPTTRSEDKILFPFANELQRAYESCLYKNKNEHKLSFLETGVKFEFS